MFREIQGNRLSLPINDIDRSSWQARGLFACFPFVFGGRAGAGALTPQFFRQLGYGPGPAKEVLDSWPGNESGLGAGGPTGIHADFNGTNTGLYVQSADVSDWVGSHSYSLWVYPDAFNAGRIISYDDASHTYHLLAQTSADVAGFTVAWHSGSNPLGNRRNFLTSVTGRWYHIAVIWFGTSTAARLFVDGVEYTDTSGGSIADGADNVDRFTIGNRDEATGFFDGRIADLRIYDHRLTPAQCRALYHPDTRWELYEHARRAAHQVLVAGHPATRRLGGVRYARDVLGADNIQVN